MNEDDPDATLPAEQEVAPAKRHGRRPPEPLKVRVELVVVDGEAGKELMKRQAAAVRDALQWFADNPSAVHRTDE
jgi:hypothetical protein